MQDCTDGHRTVLVTCFREIADGQLDECDSMSLAFLRRQKMLVVQ